MKRPCVIAASRPWFYGIDQTLEVQLKRRCFLVQKKEELTVPWLESINPEYIFFLHWSWILPETIWGHYESIIFHMTDLPYGRGGSPLQNLISRGHTDTVITALRCTGGIDDGPIYLKEPLSLNGSAEEIFLRAIPIMTRMLTRIITEKIIPTPQEGEVVRFTRRTPSQSNIEGRTTLKELYDLIRMLDADSYPKAFLNSGPFHLKFSKASFEDEAIEAKVTISLAKTKDI